MLCPNLLQGNYKGAMEDHHFIPYAFSNLKRIKLLCSKANTRPTHEPWYFPWVKGQNILIKKLDSLM
jgi:hypothetical protein